MRLVYLTSGWVLGILLQSTLFPMDTPIWIIGLVLAVILSVATNRYPKQRWYALAIIALMLGGIRQSLEPKTSDVAQYNGNNGTIEGVVIDEPDIRDDRIQLRVTTESIFTNNDTIPTSGQILVESPVLTDVKYGDRIRATGSLITPAEWDTFSYADYLGRQGVFTIMPFSAVEVTESGYGNPIFTALFDLKQIVQNQITQSLPEPQASLLVGILLGNERGISPELADDFSRVGASHVIAISGFNMVIISALIMRVLQQAFGERSRVALISGIVIIAIYTLFVGASAAVVRAAFMSILLVIAEYLNRKTYVPASLALVALILSIFQPSVLQDVGFQLSFLAVLGLALFADPLSERFRKFLDHRLPYLYAKTIHTFLNEPLIVSIAAQITTLPLIVMYFGQLSLMSIPVNVLIVPIQSYVLVFGMLAVGISFIAPTIGILVYWLDMVFLSWTIFFVRLYAQFSAADIAINFDPRIIQAGYVLFFGGTMVSATRPSWWIRLENFLRQQTVVVTIGIIGIASGILMLGMVTSRPDGKLHVWMLDLGHSNAVFVQTPGGAHMLVDGGRFPSRLLTSLGDRMPYYDRHIEILAVTHPDAFDISALNSVLDRYSVGVALWNGQPNRTETWVEIQDRLATTDMVEIRAGYEIVLDDGVIIEVLHPQVEPPIFDALGEHVMVLRIIYGDVSILLTSDITIEGQMAMLEQGISPTASVLQVPQHGTSRALSQQWLDLAQPQVALVQSDRANRRGDPDDETLAMLGDIPIFRTDEMGTIHLTSDGQDIWIIAD